MKRRIALLGALLFATLAQAQGARPEIGPRVDAYVSSTNEQVYVLRVGPESAHKAIVQFRNMDHRLNDRIIEHAVELRRDGEKRYAMQLDGERFVTLIVRGAWGELYLPGAAQPRSVRFDAGLAEQGNPDAFLSDYLDPKNNKK